MKFTKTVLSTLSAAALAIVALGLVSAPAQAGTATTTFAVTATVQATCSVTATAMAFGTYIPTAASANTSTISVTCTNGTPATFLLNAGTASGATVTNRSMTNGAVLLNYGLFSDAAHTANFGTTTTAVNGTGSPVVTTVYGQIPAGQYVAPNTYTDTITATVSY
jgi:spore coat protein U-like protein